MIKKDSKRTKYAYRIFAIFFWLLVWEGLSLWVGHDILLPSPFAVIVTLLQLIVTLDFWRTILFSSLRIVIGFLLALVIGTVLAIGSNYFRLMKELISPVMKIIQAMPVASFIILALVWIKTKNLSILASFLMVMPLIYANVAQGLKSADVKLLQMAKVFQLGSLKKIKAIYIPAVMPFLVSAVTVGLGLCWKAGIAAEVIGTPIGSIGEKLYESKLYLMIKELFAWTIVIILISILFEKTVLLLLRLLQRDNAEPECSQEEDDSK